MKRFFNYVMDYFRKDTSNYRLHAEREFRAMGYDLNDKEEGPNKWVMENVFELLRVFAKQGHSGSSAPYVANMFKQMALFELGAPLRGTEDEWMEVSDGQYQNVRCSHVFKDVAEGAYDIDGRIFRDPNGVCYTNRESRVPVTFPYTPKREYVDVAA